MKDQTAEVTRRYLKGKTLSEFAGGLGVDASRQLVWNWKEGVRAPSFEFLFAVISANGAEAWGREWAEEILVLYQQDASVKGLEG